MHRRRFESQRHGGDRRSRRDGAESSRWPRFREYAEPNTGNGFGHSDAHRQPTDQHAHASHDGNPERQRNLNAHSDSKPVCLADQHSDSDTILNGNRQLIAHRERNRDAVGHADTDTIPHRDGHAIACAEAAAIGDADREPDENSNSDPLLDPNR